MITQFDWWIDLCHAVRRKLGLPDETPQPTSDDVAGVLTADYVADSVREFVERLAAVWKAGGGFRSYGVGDSYTVEGPVAVINTDGERELVENQDRQAVGHAYGSVRLEGERLAVFEGLLAGLFTESHHMLASGFALTMIREGVRRGAFVIIHEMHQADGAGLKHPLAALIEGWLIGPPVEADERETGIIPATLASVRDADAPASLFDLREHEKVPGFTPHPIEQAYLPGLTPVGNEIAPAMPLLMWDASTEGGPRRGKGAPLPLRIWIEAVLAFPTHERFSPRRVAVRYGDLTGWLMPNGEYRQRDFPAIQRALHRVHNLRLPWELPDGTGGSRAVVVVRDIPRVWNAYDDMVTFEISLPPGINARGPIVYRPALRRLGQQSAMRYRAELGLCWLWDRYGARNGRYIQPTRLRFARDDQDRLIDAENALLLNKDGQPARTYMVPVKRNGETKRIPRPGIVPLDAEGRPVPLADAAHERNPAADRYPVLTPAQLVELCYPLNLTGKRLKPSARSMRRERALSSLKIMAEKGYCIIEDIDSGWRILPPKGWGARYSG